MVSKRSIEAVRADCGESGPQTHRSELQPPHLASTSSSSSCQYSVFRASSRLNQQNDNNSTAIAPPRREHLLRNQPPGNRSAAPQSSPYNSTHPPDIPGDIQHGLSGDDTAGRLGGEATGEFCLRYAGCKFSSVGIYKTLTSIAHITPVRTVNHALPVSLQRRVRNTNRQDSGDAHGAAGVRGVQHQAGAVGADGGGGDGGSADDSGCCDGEVEE